MEQHKDPLEWFLTETDLTEIQAQHTLILVQVAMIGDNGDLYLVSECFSMGLQRCQIYLPIQH